MRIILAIGSFLLCFGCQDLQRENVKSNISPYFSIDSLLDIHQQRLMEGVDSVEVVKMANIDGATDTTRLYLDSAGLAEEFKIWRNASINKPDLQDAYQISDSVAGNRKYRKYEAVDKNDQKIDQILSVWGAKSDTLREVQVFYFEENRLYTTQRKMRMVFAGLDIDYYKIEGYQKMITLDRTDYDLKVLFKSKY